MRAHRAPSTVEVELDFDDETTVVTSPADEPAAKMGEGALAAGLTLGHWRLLGLLGSGAFGEVYAAEHSSIAGRRAAVKVLHAHMAVNVVVKQRFLQEATAASRIDHENIIQIFDGGISFDGVCYSVMELLVGDTLSSAIGRAGLSLERTLHIAAQVARALDASHRAGIVHRDLKPDNIFLTRRDSTPDFVKVLDFGVAKLRDAPAAGTLTKAGMVVGTPGYMSPEQWMTLPDIDGRADVYALGAILHRCLTGRLPFVATTPYEWLKAHMEQPVPALPSTVAAAAQMSAVIARMMAKQRSDRYQSMAKVALALDEVRLASERARPAVLARVALVQMGRPVPRAAGPGAAARSHGAGGGGSIDLAARAASVAQSDGGSSEALASGGAATAPTAGAGGPADAMARTSGATDGAGCAAVASARVAAATVGAAGSAAATAPTGPMRTRPWAESTSTGRVRIVGAHSRTTLALTGFVLASVVFGGALAIERPWMRRAVVVGAVTETATATATATAKMAVPPSGALDPPTWAAAPVHYDAMLGAAPVAAARPVDAETIDALAAAVRAGRRDEALDLLARISRRAPAATPAPAPAPRSPRSARPRPTTAIDRPAAATPADTAVSADASGDNEDPARRLRRSELRDPFANPSASARLFLLAADHP